MSQHIGPRIITGTGGSIKRVGNYRTHTFPPEIVSEDLILHFDAGNPLSYPGTGNSVIDLSGHGHNGTLTNSPSYLTQDSGVFDFDGVNSYITTGYTREDLGNKFSLTAWFRYDGSDSRTYSAIIGGLEPGQGTEFFLGKDSGNLNFGVQDGQYTGNYVPAASHTMFNGNWHQMVYTFNNGTTKIYQDGVYKNGMTRTGCNAAEEIIIGHEAEGSFGWEGQISVVTFHTRVLLQEEITRNYNALKNRYYTYTDTFTPTCAGNTGKIELLCVAGGGGGGTCRQGDGGGGGGGAGGLIYNSAFLVNTDTSISLSVGKGGAGSTSNTSNGNSGVNSTFGSLTAIGGGGGGSTRDSTSLPTGGSGGGAGSDAGSDTGGSGTAGQGFAGGNNTTGNNGAGGGGAGGKGSSVANVSPDIGTGGDGLSYSTSGSSQYYAGGGGGGQYSSGTGVAGKGGLGGAGDGGKGEEGKSAIPGTGSGGGGGGMISGTADKQGGNGGSGKIIVRYPAIDYSSEVLIVGAGGGGGGASGSSSAGPRGGGGAGGLIYHSNYHIKAGQTYEIFVGEGGVGGNNGEDGQNGQDSRMGEFLAFGGGFGAGYTSSSNNRVGGNGGSGGGSSYVAARSTGIQGQGNAGGSGSATYNGAGGGGGAGEPGFDPPAGDAAANGGDGLAYSITGTSTYYAGGGGTGRYPANGSIDGTGGLGGGGNGSRGNDGSATSGTDGLGGGGGGAGASISSAGDGGNGVVIIAYRGPQRATGGTIDSTSRPGYTLHKFTTDGRHLFIA